MFRKEKMIMKKSFLIPSIAIIALLGFGCGAKALTLSPPTVEITAKPGEKVEVVAKLFNETNAALDLQPGVYSFSSKNESGQPDFFDDKSGLDLQHWIVVPSSVTLAPQERQSVVLTINVPKSADPGGHYASVFWGTTPPKIDGGAGIEGRIAMLILVNVEGNIKEDAKIIEFKTLKSFVTHLPVDFMARFQNNGSVHVHPAGDIIIRNMFGRQSSVMPFNIQPSTGNVLPRSIRRFDLSWVKGSSNEAASEWSKEWNNFALGRYTAELNVTYGQANKLVIATASFWVFPWMVSLAGLAVLIILLFVLRQLIINYNKAIIKKYTQGRVRK